MIQKPLNVITISLYLLEIIMKLIKILQFLIFGLLQHKPCRFAEINVTMLFTSNKITIKDTYIGIAITKLPLKFM